ncbi:MAG TPA: class I SAM-dependent methyltransferase [Polyangiaceae bacterium]|nr:class I SAM-dependent methyltransferase [Polyangiaceae bacterium]
MAVAWLGDMSRSSEPCPLCQSTLRALPEPDKTWFSGFRGRPKLVRCQDCSVIYLSDDRPERIHTRDEDYVRARILLTYNDPPREQARLFRARLERAARQVRGRRVLDIGCGNGAFLMISKQAGWEPLGLDISTTPRELMAPHGIEVAVQDPVTFLERHPASFDLIHMNHTLEHMPDAAETVLATRRALAPGGLLYVEVPNEFDNLVYRTLELLGRKRRRGSIFGRSAAPEYPSPHVYFFNKHSLARLASRAGFTSFRVDARRREPFQLRPSEVADTLAALLGAGSFLTLTASAAGP